ncbi:carboxymuconolactone decarboxylase family protein [Bdellovibrio bacteriovorus]|uniref:carboxymuconolactone decarboxylase family protein n=1 Tax=Bdellovibrio bacteriovorus TaxID=959 RepID=UPI0021D2530B|nr:carboxymuconolactone decarboxylase family protein [Bdellovibrio bacteriovorus]UXR65939.1 carboxymuconolactone decarboxylase family protein [Bdellovibrio bacteriovorus]
MHNARIQFAPMIQDHFQKLSQMSHSVETVLGESLFGLVHNRVSQINGCAFCLDMDVKKAKIRGERELRMYHIAVWRDSHLFTDRERAALEWSEAVTQLGREGVSDELYNKVQKHFTEQELVHLTLGISVVNVWNRLNVAFRNPAGSADAYFGLDKAGL